MCFFQCFNALNFSNITYRCLHTPFFFNLNSQLLFLISHKTFLCLMHDCYMTLQLLLKPFNIEQLQTLLLLYILNINFEVLINIDIHVYRNIEASERWPSVIVHCAWSFRASEHWKTSVWFRLQVACLKRCIDRLK